MAVHLSKSEFLYGDSEYAKSQRKKYGDNYKAYKKSKEIVNPMEVSKKEYIAQKEAQYKEALLNLGKSQALWDNYRKTYDVNLTAARANNNGFSLQVRKKMLYYAHPVMEPFKLTQTLKMRKLKLIILSVCTIMQLMD